MLGGAVDHEDLLPARALLRAVHGVVVLRLDRIADAVSGGELERTEGPAILPGALASVVVGQLLPVALPVRARPHQRHVGQPVVVGRLPAEQHLLVRIHLQLRAREQHRDLGRGVRLHGEGEVGAPGHLSSGAAGEDDGVGAGRLEHQAAAQVATVLDAERNHRPGAEHQLRAGHRPVRPGPQLDHRSLRTGEVPGAGDRPWREPGVGRILVEHLELAGDGLARELPSRRPRPAGREQQGADPVRPDRADQRQGGEGAEGQEAGAANRRRGPPPPAHRAARCAASTDAEVGQRELGGEGRVVRHRPAQLEDREQIQRDPGHPGRDEPRRAKGIPRRARPVPPDALGDQAAPPPTTATAEHPPHATRPGPGEQAPQRRPRTPGRPTRGAADSSATARACRRRTDRRKRSTVVPAAASGSGVGAESVSGAECSRFTAETEGAGAREPVDNPGPRSVLPGMGAHEHGLWWGVLGSGAPGRGGSR